MSDTLATRPEATATSLSLLLPAEAAGFPDAATQRPRRESAGERPASARTAARRWRRPRLGIPFSVLAARLGVARPHSELERPIREGDPRVEVARRDAVFRRSLALADAGAATATALLCVTLFGRAALHPLALLGLPLVVLAAKLVGLYDRDELLVNKGTIDEAPRVFQLATLETLLFCVGESQLVSAQLAATQLLALWATMFVFALCARGAARAFARVVTQEERCVFVGTEVSADRLRAKLEATGGHAVLVGRMTIGDLEQADAADAAGSLHRLIDELRVHRVVIEPSEPQPQATLDFVREAKATGARVSLLPRILEVVGSSIEVEDVHGLTLLGVRRFGLSRSSAALKRGLDVVGASVGLVLTAPLLGLLAGLVWLSSGGPVIYRQIRVGRDGRPFTMFKLRTMVVGADALKPALRSLNEADGLFKIADDPRLTAVGRWLRRYSLDELPQLLNVLRGEMSLVGPRPLVRDDDAQIIGLDRRRLYLTPGMTGRWQILGAARVPMSEMIKLDYLYVTGWSLWSDLKILLRTVPYVLARRGM